MAGRGGDPRPQGREIYFEMMQVGHFIKMSAIDAATGLEVSIMGPLNASRTDLERIALQKLCDQLAKRER